MSSTDDKLAFLRAKLPEAEEPMLLDLLVSCGGDLATTLKLLGVKDDRRVQQQATLKKFVQTKDGKCPTWKKTRTDIKGKTIHIYNPAELHELLPLCSLHLNVFEPELADDLLKYLLHTSENWTVNRFYLFQREVESAHTTGIFSDNQRLLENNDATYNGKIYGNMRPFNDVLRNARDIVENITNKEIKERGLAKYQYPGEWKSDVALCNRYDGAKSSVGYHSDQLTHIGPHCVISSISLGTTREFRLKDRHNNERSTFSVHLPHNSLIIMHAGCQEEFKHSIVSVAAPLHMHPISGSTRINITYRMYLEEFETNNVPKCKCNRPMILRNTKTKDRDWKYIWQCGGGYTSAEGGCGLVTYPNFRANF